MVRYVSIVAIVAVALACHRAPFGPDKTIVLTPHADTAVVGQSVSFVAQVWEGGVPLATAPRFQWSTSDRSVATVGLDGKAEGVGPGVATIAVAAAGTAGASATLVVLASHAIEVASIVVAPAIDTITTGAAVLYSACAFDSVGAPRTDAAYQWTVSHPSIAFAITLPPFGYGLVVGLRPGRSEVRASVGHVVSAPSLLIVRNGRG